MKIYTFHGNPGSASDWENLKSLTPPEFSYIDLTYDQSYPDQLTRLSQEKCPFILAGHSYGCYEILKLLPMLRLAERHHALLISPYVTPERALSGFVCSLLETPWIGTKLIHGNHKKSWEKFLSDLIYPESLNDRVSYPKIKEFLSSTRVWEQTVHLKIQMQKNPLDVNKPRKDNTLNESDPTQLTIHWGEQDRISNKALQLGVFNTYKKKQIISHPHGGHGLLWSHSLDLVSSLVQIKNQLSIS